MIKLPAGPERPKLTRVAAYAAIAALLTTVLFAADGTYRWFHTTRPQTATPLTGVRSVEAPGPAPVETQAATPPVQVVPEAPKPEANRIEERPAAAQAAAAAGGPVSNPAGSIPPANAPNSDPVSGSLANSAGSSPANPAAAPSPRLAGGSDDAAPKQALPKLSHQPNRQQVRRPPARQAARDRAAPRRPVQAATKPPARAEKPAEKPNIYWERDGGGQLGYAPQLRKRTCNPATGQMPMQCYYPREGRERFPARPLN
jgi:hypothetical protein